MQSAGDIARESNKDVSSSLESLADNIDTLDKKLTYGMLLVGGLAAITNPILGAGIAAKALIPGAVGLLNEHGLRPAGEKLSHLQLNKAIKEAESKIIKEFESAQTLRIVNPLLCQLALSLRTSEEQYDPLVDPDFSHGDIPELSGERWRELTEKAIYHVYKEVYEDRALHEEACLGSEDIRWLKTFFVKQSGN